MSWKKYFSPVPTGSSLSTSDGFSNGTRPGPARSNYSSYLPDVYSGTPNRLDRYQQYDVMDSDPEVNAALDILAEFCTQKLKDGKSPFAVNWRHKGTNSEVKIYSNGTSYKSLIHVVSVSCVTRSSTVMHFLSVIQKLTSGII
jgi:hypothetical protein